MPEKQGHNGSMDGKKGAGNDWRNCQEKEIITLSSFIL